MRVMGHNMLAIILAAIAIYALEFVFFALLMTPEQFQSTSGYTGGEMSRMPFGAVAPLLAAIGLSLAIKWRDQPGWMSGAVTGVLMAIFLAFAGSLYSFVYGPNTPAFVGIHFVHFTVCYAVAGAILGAWK